MDTALTALAALGGFSSVGDWVYGDCEGFPFCIGESDGEYHIQWGVSGHEYAVVVLRGANDLLKNNAPMSHTTLTFQSAEKSVLAKLRLTDTFDVERDLLHFLQACAKTLLNADIPPACFSCGNDSEPYTFYKWGEQPVAFCDNCAESKRESYRSGDDQVGKSALRGTIGAVLGGIFGIIPWLIVSHFGYIVALFGFVIVFCAQKGYHMMGGRRGRIEGVILVFVTLLCVLLATYTSLLIEVSLLFNESGYVFTLLEIAAFVWHALITAPHEMYEVWGNLALSLLFAFMGARQLLASSLRNNPEPPPVFDLP